MAGPFFLTIVAQARVRSMMALIVPFLIVALTPGLLGADAAKAPLEKKLMNEVTGEFEVKILPADTSDPQMGVMTLDKQYHGDLQANGKGRMLTGMTDAKTSAAYVAMERVQGSLKGAEGSFLLCHMGLMTQESQSLVIRIVPDSGTGALAGIQGEMHIQIVNGKHFYRLEYTLEKKR